jgi:hypothetical protein
MRINFDMDGTIANLYGVDGWLEKLINEDATPYANAQPLVDMKKLGRALRKAQAKGNEIAIISWGSKGGSPEYLERVRKAKEYWLRKHLPKVEWNDIKVVPYGTPKSQIGNGILFDDEQKNLDEWGENAYTPNQIFKVLAHI